MLSSSASRTLLQTGCAIPQSFIKIMGAEALLISKRNRHTQALMSIVNLIEKYPQVLQKHLPLTVSTIIRCLDPSAPRRRKALLQATTTSLHVLVQKYPNVAFHQETQHFAIGTGPNRENVNKQLFIYFYFYFKQHTHTHTHKHKNKNKVNFNLRFKNNYSLEAVERTFKCSNSIRI